METAFIYELTESPQDGRAHIVGANVEWCVDIVDGQMLLAAHSLQHVTGLTSVLPALGYESALPAYQQLVSAGPYQKSLERTGLEALAWTSRVLGALLQQGVLNLQQAQKTLLRLSEEAIASLLALPAATITWRPLPTGSWHLNHAGIELLRLIQALRPRLELWQALSDCITSPHQRPYCNDPKQLIAAADSGPLSADELATLLRLMQGDSIRQLAQFSKLDELKLAQLLHPYIQRSGLKLWPPVAPLDQLPWIQKQATAGAYVNLADRSVNPSSASPSSTGPNSTSARFSSPSTPTTPKPPAVIEVLSVPLEPEQSKTAAPQPYRIACIDDSQALLNRIRDYLEADHFSLESWVDPLRSISKICSMKPDLILLDVTLPKINGHNLCKVLRRGSHFKDIPIVMISSNTNALNKAKAKAAGATDYLEKPFSKAQLLDVLNAHLPPPPLPPP